MGRGETDKQAEQGPDGGATGPVCGSLLGGAGRAGLHATQQGQPSSPDGAAISGITGTTVRDPPESVSGITGLHTQPRVNLKVLTGPGQILDAGAFAPYGTDTYNGYHSSALKAVEEPRNTDN